MRVERTIVRPVEVGVPVVEHRGGPIVFQLPSHVVGGEIVVPVVARNRRYQVEARRNGKGRIRFQLIVVDRGWE
jgi:hypothetical protein